MPDDVMPDTMVQPVCQPRGRDNPSPDERDARQIVPISLIAPARCADLSATSVAQDYAGLGNSKNRIAGRVHSRHR
jgi:hypothetical protein